MLSLFYIIQIALALVPLYSIIATAAATQSESSLISTTPTSSTSSSQITTSSSVLRPTEGEIVVYGSQYTIRWSPPTIAGGISIELWNADSESSAYSFGFLDQYGMTMSCDGWLVNLHCGKIAQSVPNNGSYVWNISSTTYEFLSEGTYYLGIYIQQPHNYDLPTDRSPWYVKSGIFTLTAPASSSSSSSGATVTSSTTLNSSFSTSTGVGQIATSTGVGQTATSSTGGVGRITADQSEWTFLGIMGVLAMVQY